MQQLAQAAVRKLGELPHMAKQALQKGTADYLHFLFYVCPDVACVWGLHPATEPLHAKSDNQGSLISF